MTASTLLRTPAVRILLPGFVAAGLLFIATRPLMSPLPSTPPIGPPRLITSGVAQNYRQALDQADAAVDAARQRAEAQPGQWLPLESLGRAQFARARLTGDLASYSLADDAFERAFQGLNPGIGPHLSRAEFSLGVHRLAAAEADLTRVEAYKVPPDSAERAEIRAMRGDIAFYRGDYQAARRLYDEAATHFPGAGIDLRLANHAMRLGRPEEALDWLDRAQRSTSILSPQLAARIEWQRGLVERSRGAWDAAARHFATARKLFPGWWQADQQGAAMTALAGNLADATRRFEALAARTGQPEPMDAAAALYRATGDAERSRIWSTRAANLWETRLATFPDAFAGHAIDHLLAFGDPSRALALAEASYRLRPFGETAIGLAAALLANGRPAAALALLERVDASGWVTAEQHMLAAQALIMLGRGAEAALQTERARAIDPHSSDRNPALLWFDH